MLSIRAQIEAIAQRRMQDVEEIARVSIIRVANRIITDTPVAKGSLINHWNTNINTIGYDSSSEDNSSGSDAINQLNETINDMSLGVKAYFNNPMPYGPRIEYDGHSDKAKNGMVRINTALWSDIVEEEIARRR